MNAPPYSPTAKILQTDLKDVWEAIHELKATTWMQANLAAQAPPTPTPEPDPQLATLMAQLNELGAEVEALHMPILQLVLLLLTFMKMVGAAPDWMAQLVSSVPLNFRLLRLVWLLSLLAKMTLTVKH